jgi:phosphate starvation-inducible protein PhoH and related proteins
MIEKKIYLEGVDPVKLFGIKNSRFERIVKNFPKIKVVARGDELNIKGEEKELKLFEEVLSDLIDYIQSTDDIDEDYFSSLVEGSVTDKKDQHNILKTVLFFGNNGKPIRAKTINQKKLVEESSANDLVLAIGPAGTGKTYTAIALAVRALKYQEIKRIILTRPAVEAGERLGFLPGDYKEKLDPYMQPLYDALNDMIPSKKLKTFLEDSTIQIAPLAFMRGRTLDNAFVILDEAQNATFNQLKMFLTRMGKTAKFIVTGDITQIDLPDPHDSGLVKAVELLAGISGISVIYFDSRDIIRHKLVKYIVEAFRKK